MSASGFDLGSFGPGIVNNNQPKRKLRTRTIQTLKVLGSSDPILFTNTAQSCFVFGQISSTQSNIDAQPSDAEAIQPGVAEEKGSSIGPSMEDKGSSISPSLEDKCSGISPSIDEKGSTISPSMDALVLTDIKETNQESSKTSLVIVSRILKGIPQSPHFYELRNLSDCARTFMISAWDRVFEEVYEQIKSLQANDFCVKSRELWKTIEELQTMGYNVIPLRRRIVELSDVIREVKLSKLKMKRLKMKAENHRAEKSRYEFTILKLRDMIRNEEDGMYEALDQVAELEKELPKIDGVFAKICKETLVV